VTGTALYAQKAPGIDLGALNRNVDPCANFYQYACGGWMTANPLPGDASRWGRFDALQDRNRVLLREVLEAAATDRPGRSAIDQKIGDFYAACMDEKNLDARGLEAIQRDLKVVGRFYYLDIVKSKPGYMKFVPPTVRRLQRNLAHVAQSQSILALLSEPFEAML